MKLKTTISTLLILTLFGCSKEQPVGEQASKIVVVNAYLDINKPINNIKVGNLFSLNDVDISPLEDLEVRIEHKNEVYFLTEYEEGLYRYNDQSVKVVASTSYQLIIETPDATLTSSTRTPRDKGTVSLTDTELNTDFVDQIDIAVGEPDDGSKVFYIVNITPLEDELIPIDFNTISQSTRSSWIEENDGYIPLRTSFFLYYGTHRIDVQRIDFEFIDLFRGAEEDGFLTNPGNIDNGKGFFVGKDEFSVEIELLN